MGKNSNNLSNFVNVFIVLIVIILVIGIVQFVKPGQVRNTAATTGTATLVPTQELKPTFTPTLLPKPPPETVTAPPPSPTAATTSSETAIVSDLDRTTTTPLYTYEVIASYPHDPMAFTQGLIIVDGIMYEGTGRYQQSTLRQVDLSTGNSLQRTRLPDELFGEGITLFDDRIIQLTWKAGIGFVYSKDTFELLQTFTYPTEGWGITHDGERLIMSDGTANLYFRDPKTFDEIGRVEVFDENGPVVMLNELEYINGEVFANVWKTDKIARIDPETGQVTGWILLTDLLSPEELTNPADMQNGIAVLNGIAYDATNDRLFVTGKLWPTLFEIEIVPVNE